MSVGVLLLLLQARNSPHKKVSNLYLRKQKLMLNNFIHKGGFLNYLYSKHSMEVNLKRCLTSEVASFRTKAMKIA